MHEDNLELENVVVRQKEFGRRRSRVGMDKYHNLISDAMAEYQSDEEVKDFDEEIEREYVDYILRQIHV